LQCSEVLAAEPYTDPPSKTQKEHFTMKEKQNIEFYLSLYIEVEDN